MEELEEKHGHHYLHIKIRTITNVKRFLDPLNSIINKAEENIYEKKQKSKTDAVEYSIELFDDTRDDGVLPAIRNNIEWEPTILMYVLA